MSQAGGVQPRWSPDGQELFFLDPEGWMTSVRMTDSDPRRASAPQPLFAAGLVPSDALDQYAPLREGFLLRTPIAGADSAAVQIVVNWKSLVASK